MLTCVLSLVKHVEVGCADMCGEFGHTYMVGGSIHIWWARSHMHMVGVVMATHAHGGYGHSNVFGGCGCTYMCGG